MFIFTSCKWVLPTDRRLLGIWHLRNLLLYLHIVFSAACLAIRWHFFVCKPQALPFKLISSHFYVIFMYSSHWRIFICTKVPRSQTMAVCNLCFCCFVPSFFFFLFKKFCFYFIALWADLAFKRHVLVECGLSLTRCCGSCMLFTLKKVEILLIASAHATSLPAFKYKSMPLHSLTYWSYVKIYVHMYLNIYMYAIDCRLFICLLPFVGRRHFFTRFT